MQFAINDSTPIGSSVKALRLLKSIAKTHELKSVVQSALDEALISQETDHFGYVFSKSLLWPSNLGYGLWTGLNAPSDASDLYTSVSLQGMREFKNAGLQGDDA
jgi:hypothetical protein